MCRVWCYEQAHAHPEAADRPLSTDRGLTRIPRQQIDPETRTPIVNNIVKGRCVPVGACVT
eukprot:733138-Rhodomonas_salina.5